MLILLVWQYLHHQKRWITEHVQKLQHFERWMGHGWKRIEFILPYFRGSEDDNSTTDQAEENTLYRWSPFHEYRLKFMSWLHIINVQKCPSQSWKTLTDLRSSASTFQVCCHHILLISWLDGIMRLLSNGSILMESIDDFCLSGMLVPDCGRRY